MASPNEDDNQCYAFDSERLNDSKRCKNKATCYFEEKYDDPDIIGRFYMQLCDSCFETIIDEKNREYWKRIVEDKTTGLIS